MSENRKRDPNLPFKKRVINGTTYVAYTLKFDKWAALTEYLGTLLGDPLAQLLRGDRVMPDGMDSLLGQGDLQELLGMLVKSLSSQRLMDMCTHMSRSLRVNNGGLLKVETQMTWWPGHMRDLVPVVILFLEAQYSDFYEGLGESLPSGESSDSDQDEPESASSGSPTD